MYFELQIDPRAGMLQMLVNGRKENLYDRSFFLESAY